MLSPRVFALASSITLALGCFSPTSIEGLPPDKHPTEKTPAQTTSAASATPRGAPEATSPPPADAATGAWASDVEHEELAAIVRPIVEPHLGTALPWGGVPAIGVGVLRNGKQYFFGFGNDRNGKPVARTTLFEIGSITKTFVGLVLADAAMKGKVALDDPANKHLPSRLRVPSRNGKEITLRHLATHRAGFPRMTKGTLETTLGILDPAGLSLSIPQLEAWLKTATLERDPGESMEYSNIGAALVAYALEEREKRPWADLVADLVTTPLGMPSTRVMDGSPLPDKVAGYNLLGQELAVDGMTGASAYAPAGAIRSNIEDMLRYARVHARLTPSSVDPLVAFAQRRHGAGLDPIAAALSGTHFELGLLVMREGSGDVPDAAFHNGTTSGFTSEMRVSKTQGVATVVLTNRCFMDPLRRKTPADVIDEALFDAIR